MYIYKHIYGHIYLLIYLSNMLCNKIIVHTVSMPKSGLCYTLMWTRPVSDIKQRIKLYPNKHGYNL